MGDKPKILTGSGIQTADYEKKHFYRPKLYSKDGKLLNPGTEEEQEEEARQLLKEYFKKQLGEEQGEEFFNIVQTVNDEYEGKISDLESKNVPNAEKAVDFQYNMYQEGREKLAAPPVKQKYLSPAERIRAGQKKSDNKNGFDPEGDGYDTETAEYLKKKNPLTIPKPDKYEGDYVEDGDAFEAWVWHPELNDYKKHGGSFNPENGMLLKGLKHETFHLTKKTEDELNNQIYKGEDGRYYSKPREKKLWDQWDAKGETSERVGRSPREKEVNAIDGRLFNIRDELNELTQPEQVEKRLKEKHGDINVFTLPNRVWNDEYKKLKAERKLLRQEMKFLVDAREYVTGEVSRLTNNIVKEILKSDDVEFDKNLVNINGNITEDWTFDKPIDDHFVKYDGIDPKIIDNLRKQGYSKRMIDNAINEIQTKILPNAQIKLEEEKLRHSYGSEPLKPIVMNSSRDYALNKLFNSQETEKVKAVEELRSLYKDKKSYDEETGELTEVAKKKIEELKTKYGKDGWIDLETGYKITEAKEPTQEEFDYVNAINHEIKNLRSVTDKEKLEQLVYDRYLIFRRNEAHLNNAKRNLQDHNENPEVFFDKLGEKGQIKIEKHRIAGDQIRGEIGPIESRYNQSKINYEAAARLLYLNQTPKEIMKESGPGIKLIGKGAADFINTSLSNAIFGENDPIKQSQGLNEVLNASKIHLTDDELDDINTKLSHQMLYGSGGIIGVLGYFAIANKIGGAVGIEKGLANIALAAKVSKNWSGTLKVINFIARSAYEEAKFRPISEEWGHGATFYAASQGVNLIKIPGLNKYAGRLAEAVKLGVKADISMTAASDLNHMIHTTKEFLNHSDDFRYAVEQYWGATANDVFNKYAVDFATNWLFGVKTAIEAPTKIRARELAKMKSFKTVLIQEGDVEGLRIVNKMIKDIENTKDPMKYILKTKEIEELTKKRIEEIENKHAEANRLYEEALKEGKEEEIAIQKELKKIRDEERDQRISIEQQTKDERHKLYNLNKKGSFEKDTEIPLRIYEISDKLEKGEKLIEGEAEFTKVALERLITAYEKKGLKNTDEFYELLELVEKYETTSAKETAAKLEAHAESSARREADRAARKALEDKPDDQLTYGEWEGQFVIKADKFSRNAKVGLIKKGPDGKFFIQYGDGSREDVKAEDKIILKQKGTPESWRNVVIRDEVVHHENDYISFGKSPVKFKMVDYGKKDGKVSDVVIRDEKGNKVKIDQPEAAQKIVKDKLEVKVAEDPKKVEALEKDVTKELKKEAEKPEKKTEEVKTETPEADPKKSEPKQETPEVRTPLNPEEKKANDKYNEIVQRAERSMKPNEDLGYKTVAEFNKYLATNPSKEEATSVLDKWSQVKSNMGQPNLTMKQEVYLRDKINKLSPAKKVVKAEPAQPKPEVTTSDPAEKLLSNTILKPVETEVLKSDSKDSPRGPYIEHGGSKYPILKIADSEGKFSKEQPAGTKVSVEYIDPKTSNEDKVGALAVINGKFKYENDKALYDKVFLVSKKGADGSKETVGIIKGRGVKPEDMPIIQNENFFNNFIFGGVKPEKGKTSEELGNDAMDKLRDNLGNISQIKKAYDFENPKSRNDVIAQIRDIVKAFIDVSKDKLDVAIENAWNKFKTKLQEWDIPETTKKFIADFAENNKELILGARSAIIKTWDKVAEIQINENEAIATDALGKISHLRKPTRRFFREMERLGVKEAEKKVLFGVKITNLEKHLETEEMFEEYKAGIKNPELRFILSYVDYQQAQYLDAVYRNSHLHKNIGFEYVQAGESKMIKLNYSPETEKKFTKDINKHLSSFTFKDENGVVQKGDLAFQKAHKDYKNKLDEIRNTQGLSAEERGKRRHDLFISHLSRLTGLEKKYWDNYFDPKFKLGEDEYVENKVSKTPRIINALDRAVAGALDYPGKKQGNTDPVYRSLRHYFITSSSERSETNVRKLSKIIDDPQELVLDFRDVENNRAVSIKQSSHLLNSLYRLSDETYDSDFYKNNHLIQYFRKKGEVPSLGQIGGVFTQRGEKKANAPKSMTDSELMRALVISYIRSSGEYMLPLGQFGDKKDINTVDVPKYENKTLEQVIELYKAKYQKELLRTNKHNESLPKDKKLSVRIASVEELMKSAQELYDNTYSIIDSRDREIVDSKENGGIKYFQKMMLENALNKYHMDQIIHGDLLQYGNAIQETKRAQTAITPGIVPNRFIKGGVGWRKDPVTGEEVRTDHFRHVTSNDLWKVIKYKPTGSKEEIEKMVESGDGVEFVLLDHAKRYQVSLGDIVSRKDVYEVMSQIKSSFSNVNESGRRALTKGNIVVIDPLAKMHPGSAFENLYEYMKKHQIDRLSFKSTTKFTEGKVTELFDKDGKFHEAEPFIDKRSINDIIYQQDLRHDSNPKTNTEAKQSIANDMPFESAKETTEMYNRLRDRFENRLKKIIKPNNEAAIRKFLIDKVDPEQMENVIDHLEAGGSLNHPVFQNIIQKVIASAVTKEALSRKINRSSLTALPQLDVHLEPYTVKDGKVSLAWINASGPSYLREAKYFEYDPKDPKSKSQATMEALKYAGQHVDMKDKKGNVYTQEIKDHEITEGKRAIIVPGEPLRGTRVPADNPRSHSIGRLHKRYPEDTNFIMMHIKEAIKAGEDYDGDARLTQMFFKNKKSKVNFDESIRGIVNQAYLNRIHDYYDPKYQTLLERVLDKNIFDKHLPKDWKQQESKLKSNNFMDYVTIRRIVAAGVDVVGMTSDFRTLYAYLDKIPTSPKQRPMINDKIIIDQIQKDPYGLIAEVIGVVQNLALDNVKEPKIHYFNINKHTANQFLSLLISSDKISTKDGRQLTAEEQFKAIDKYTGELIKYFNSPLMKDYVKLMEKKGEVESQLTRDQIYKSLIEDYKHESTDVAALKTLNKYTAEIELLLKYIKIGREVPQNINDLEQAEETIKKVHSKEKYGSLQFIDATAFAKSIYTENTQASVRMAREFVMMNDPMVSPVGNGIIESFRKGKLTKLQQKYPAIKRASFTEDEINNIAKISQQVFAINSLSKGEKLSELEKELVNEIEKFDPIKKSVSNDPFTENLIYNRYKKQIELIDKGGAVSEKSKEEAFEQFRSYDTDTQRKWMLYMYYKYGTSISKSTGNFVELIPPDVSAKFNELYEGEVLRWNKGLVSPRERKDFIEIIKYKSKAIDFENKYHSEKQFDDHTRVMPDINFRKNLLTDISQKITSVQQFEEYRKNLSKFENQVIDQLLSQKPEGERTSVFMEKKLQDLALEEKGNYKGIEIVNGGYQLGADMGGADGAKQAGRPTGGYAAAGFVQSPSKGIKVPNKKLATEYSAVEGKMTKRILGDGKIYNDPYYDRTIRNAQENDGTLWMGFEDSPGARLTLGREAQAGKPPPLKNPKTIEEIEEWANKYQIRRLNVAGNREFTNPGIYEYTRSLIKGYFDKLDGKTTDFKPVTHVEDYTNYAKAAEDANAGKGVWVMRPNKSVLMPKNEHYGNPWVDKTTALDKKTGQIRTWMGHIVENRAEALKNYRDWLTTEKFDSDPELLKRKEWILNNLDKLQNKKLIYYKPEKYESHADVLLELVLKSAKPTQKTFKQEDVLASVDANQKKEIKISEDEKTRIIDGRTYRRMTDLIPDTYKGDPAAGDAQRKAGTLVHDIYSKRIIDGKFPEKPEGISDKAYEKLQKLIDKHIEDSNAKGETLKSEIVVWDDGTMASGAIDILASNKKGEFTIKDIKTSSSFTDYDVSFHGGMTKKEKHGLQTSGYANMFGNQYGPRIENIEIIRIETTTDKNGFINDLSEAPLVRLKFNKAANDIIPPRDHMAAVAKELRTNDIKTKDNIIEFNSETSEFSWLSNFFMKEFKTKKGRIVPSAEHYYQGLKPKTIEGREEILSTKTPSVAKFKARSLAETKGDIRDDWDQVRGVSMLNVIREKFKEPELRVLLKQTERKELVHTLPERFAPDKYWGVDHKGEGRNQLGKILMAVREEIILEDTKTETNDIIDKLNRLKVKNNKGLAFASIFAGMEVQVWNSIINTAVAGIKVGRAGREIAKEIIDASKNNNEDWYREYSKMPGANDEILENLISIQAYSRKLFHEGKDAIVFQDAQKIREQILRLSNHPDVNKRRQFVFDLEKDRGNIPLSVFSDIVGRSLRTKLEEVGYTKAEYDLLTPQEQVEYATGLYKKGELRMVSERLNPASEEISRFKESLTENQYMSKFELRGEGEHHEIKTSDPEANTSIPQNSRLYDLWKNAKYESYRNYINDEFHMRYIYESQLKGRTLDALADLHNGMETIENVRRKIENIDPAASSALRTYIDEALTHRYWLREITDEWTPGYRGSYVWTRAMGDILNGNISDLFTASGKRGQAMAWWTPLQSLLLHKIDIDKDVSLVQAFTSGMFKTERAYKDDTYAFNTEITNLRKELGIDKKVMKSLIGARISRKQIKVNEPSWMIKESNLKRYLPKLHEQDFEKLFNKELSEDKISEMAIIANAIAHGLPHEKGTLTEAEYNRVVASSKLLNTLRVTLTKYDPRFKDTSREELNEMDVKMPEVFMSRIEANNKFGNIGSKLYKYLEPKAYDEMLIKDDMTYKEYKVKFAKDFSKETNPEVKKAMMSEISEIRRTAIQELERGGKHPDAMKVRNSMKRIFTKGDLKAELPREFLSEDFWYNIQQISESQIRSHYLNKFAPIAEYLHDKHPENSSARKWLRTDINREIYGLSGESNQMNETAQNFLQRMIVYNALISLPWNIRAARANIAAGMLANFLENPDASTKGINIISPWELVKSTVIKDTRFRKMVRIMNNEEIATVINDSEIQTLSDRNQKIASMNFWMMENSERVIQSVVAYGMMKQKGISLKDYDSDGRLLPGKKGLNYTDRQEIKTELQRLHGPYGSSRAHYAQFVSLRALAQFRYPWYYRNIANMFAPERTDYLGTYRVGAVPAVFKHGKVIRYNLMSPERREALAQKVQAEYDKEKQDKRISMVDHLIRISNGEKIDMDEVPTQIRAGYKKILARTAYIYMGNVLKSYLIGMADELSIYEDDRRKRLAQIYNTLGMSLQEVLSDATLSYDAIKLYQNLERPLPAAQIFQKSMRLARTLDSMTLGGDDHRYKSSTDRHARGELRIVDDAMALFPALSKPYLFLKIATRKRFMMKYKERDSWVRDESKGEIFMGLVDQYIMNNYEDDLMNKKITEKHYDEAEKWVMENEMHTVNELYKQWLESYDESIEMKRSLWNDDSMENMRFLLENALEIEFLAKKVRDEYMEKNKQKIKRRLKNL